MKRLNHKPKIDRQKIFNKYGGHCAYCGRKITIKSFQVDHIWPKQLSHWKKESDPNREENLNPSCRKCNLHKRGWRLDNPDFPSNSWRYELSQQIDRLRKNAQFDRALRFGQVIIAETPITFYYEKIDP